MVDQGRSWHGDTTGHQKTGKQSSGNKVNPKRHAVAGHKGGRARRRTANQDMLNRDVNTTLLDEDL